MGSSLTPQQIQKVLAFEKSYVSSQAAGFLSIGLFTLLVYEYVITFEDERKNFWKGPFSISHGLFFFNRYFSLLIVSLSLLLYTSPNPTDEVIVIPSFICLFDDVLIRKMNDSCKNTIRGSFYANAIGLGVIQAILTTRVWFLFPGNRTVYFGLLFSFGVSFILTIVAIGVSLSRLKILSSIFFHIEGEVSLYGCHAVRPPMFWTVYVPSLVLHTGLYLMTLYQSIHGTECAKKRDLRRLLIVDGSLFYFIMLVSVMFVTIGAFLKDIPQVNVSAIFSPTVITTTSIVTSRIMFGLRSYFLEVENNLGWEVTTVRTTKHHPKSSLTDSLRSTIVSPPLPRVYRIVSFGPHYHARYSDPVEEEKGRVFDAKIASVFSDRV